MCKANIPNLYFYYATINPKSQVPIYLSCLGPNSKSIPSSILHKKRRRTNQKLPLTTQDSLPQFHYPKFTYHKSEAVRLKEKLPCLLHASLSLSGTLPSCSVARLSFSSLSLRGRLGCEELRNVSRRRDRRRRGAAPSEQQPCNSGKPSSAGESS